MSERFANPKHECDMVMKGGITSGVIYPRAVCELAETYRFRSLGGASAGAIAAGAAAAAELGREMGGFDKLYEVPTDAAQRLPTLFQPTKSTQPAMAVLLTLLKPRTGPFAGLRKYLAVVTGVVRWRFWWFVSSFVAITAVIALGAIGMVGLPIRDGQWAQIVRSLALPVALISIPMSILAAAFGVVKLVFTKAPGNYMGLANGMPGELAGPALTPWLHETLQHLAGQTKVLTLGDLWGSQAEIDPKLTPEELRRSRRIDLALVTTNLTQGVPYALPLTTGQWAYCPLCFADLFPEDICEYLTDHSSEPTPADTRAKDGKSECDRHDTPVALRLLPEPKSMPVLVLVRMSLSFPVLISAVPLYFFGWVNHEFNRELDGMYWKLNWFSDGGIGSNFPVHFFDSPWPMRPTFAIDLQPSNERREAFRKRVGQPAEPMYYLRKTKTTSPSPAHRPVDSLGGFLGRIATTAQNWHDTSTALNTGYADRVLTVYHRSSEGGMNLRMDPTVVDKLAARGEIAAAEYEKRFQFGHHRWLRYRVAMTELGTLLRDMSVRYDAQPDSRDWPSWRDLIADPKPHMGLDDDGLPLVVPNTPDTTVWRRRDQLRTEEIVALGATLADDPQPVTDDEPSPRRRPALRLETRQLDRGG